MAPTAMPTTASRRIRRSRALTTRPFGNRRNKTTMVNGSASHDSSKSFSTTAAPGSVPGLRIRPVYE